MPQYPCTQMLGSRMSLVDFIWVDWFAKQWGGAYEE
jgi:hypothetical protein